MASGPTISTRQLTMSSSTISRVLSERYADQARLQEQLATGQKVRKASDDPTAFGTARRLDSVVSQYDQYVRSIQSARIWTDSAQDSLDQIAELVTQAYEEGIRGANDTMGDAERELIADRVDRIFEEVINRLNDSTTDGYLFAGTDTQTKPFLNDGSGTADAAGVTYYGNSGTVTQLVGMDLRMAVGISGSRLANTGSGTITEALSDLSTALRANDVSGITSAIGSIQTARDHVVELGSEVGVSAERLNVLEERLTEMNLRVQEQRSGLEDADLAETVVEIQKAQTGLQAALQAVASLYQHSILNYLR